MANEGSTKPTYSALERTIEAGRVEDGRMQREIFELQASLARVRGLLQRLLGVEELFNLHFFAGESVGAAIKRELGAESADIGKLEAADKSGKVNRVRECSCCEHTPCLCSEDLGCNMEAVPKADDYVPPLPGKLYQHDQFIYDTSESAGHVPIARFFGRPDLPNDRTLRLVAKVVELYNAGSAETGGEKAAPPINVHDLWGWYGMLSLLYYRADIRNWGTIGMPHKEEVLGVIAQFERACKELEANFRRSSQNQAASSGVEGAHEGTTADKSEPEKLNNAQYVRGLVWKLRNTAKSALRDAEREADAWLAESSLSSPPPEKEKL